MKILFISPYIPKECGIATYTHNLISSFDKTASCSVVAIKDLFESKKFPKEVICEVAKNNINEYKQSIKKINNTNYSVVSLQHEFGLFGEKEGLNVLNFINDIKKPIVVTYHTVLSQPNHLQKKIVTQMSSKASAIIVMADEAKKRLKNIYGVAPQKIFKIPHGVPDISIGKSNQAKELLNLSGRKVVSVFGLLSRNKGIEFVIHAIPKIINEHPEIVFLLIGKTHPSILLTEGEEYRNYLIGQAEKLKIIDNVRFINKFMTHEEISRYLRATDIYITPYLEKEQITSGTLSYALSAANPIISTPYAYAKELLRYKNGFLVPFRNSGAIASKINKLFRDEELRRQMAENSYAVARKMLWKNVARDHLVLFQQVISNQTIDIHKKDPKSVKLYDFITIAEK